MSGCVMELLFPAMLWKPELYTLVHWRGPDFNADSDRWLGPLGRPGSLLFLGETVMGSTCEAVIGIAAVCDSVCHG